jgi:hypothetical protein
MLYAYAHSIFSRIKWQPAIIARNFADGDSGFICHPHHHFITRGVNGKPSTSKPHTTLATVAGAKTETLLLQPAGRLPLALN